RPLPLLTFASGGLGGPIEDGGPAARIIWPWPELAAVLGALALICGTATVLAARLVARPSLARTLRLSGEEEVRGERGGARRMGRREHGRREHGRREHGRREHGRNRRGAESAVRFIRASGGRRLAGHGSTDPPTYRPTCSGRDDDGGTTGDVREPGEDLQA